MGLVSSGLVLSLGLLTQAAKTSGDWSRVDAEDGSYSVTFPAAVSTKTQDVNTAAGKVHQEIRFCRRDGALFTFQHLGLETAIPSAQARGWLTAQRKGYIRGDSKLVDEKPLDRDGLLGDEFDYQGKAPAGTVRSRTRQYLKGRDYYSLTVMSAPDRPLPGEAARFLDSLKLREVIDQARGATTAGSKTANATPEEAFRTFMIAIVSHDEATLREVTLPAEGFELLLTGKAAPASALGGIKQQLTSRPIRRLKAGDRYPLPPGKSGVVGAEEVGPDRAVLMPEGSPVPTRLEKVKGRWKVDARPVIAARKAAGAARRNAEAKQDGPPN